MLAGNRDWLAHRLSVLSTVSVFRVTYESVTLCACSKTAE